jgi:hypothetical protein
MILYLYEALRSLQLAVTVAAHAIGLHSGVTNTLSSYGIVGASHTDKCFVAMTIV